MRSALVFLLIVMLSPFSICSAAICVEESNTAVVYFANGMFNDPIDASNSLVELAKKFTFDGYYSSTQLSGYNFQFSIAYNRNEGMASLVQVLVQKEFDDFGKFWRYLSGIEIGPDWFQGAMTDLASNYDRALYVVDDDLQRHVQNYRGQILEGKKVLVVAHSQGNFYANEAYSNLYSGTNPIDSDSFGIVSVATPASYVAGDGPHTTLLNDWVINAVRVIFPSTLFGTLNLNNTNQDADWKHHDFVASYLIGNSSGPKIMEDTVSVISDLDWPVQVAEQGIITVTLEWGSQPDVDLHVFEPEGTHVYYSNMTGSYGYLDVDDTTSYGPEHYYVSCSDLGVGTYEIGVNYYSGSAPEIARIQIQAGLSVRNYEEYLPFSMGSSGNSNPIPVAAVSVTYDSSTDAYDFVIIER